MFWCRLLHPDDSLFLVLSLIFLCVNDFPRVIHFVLCYLSPLCFLCQNLCKFRFFWRTTLTVDLLKKPACLHWLRHNLLDFKVYFCTAYVFVFIYFWDLKETWPSIDWSEMSSFPLDNAIFIFDLSVDILGGKYAVYKCFTSVFFCINEKSLNQCPYDKAEKNMFTDR